MMIFHIEIVIMSIIKSKKVRSYKEKCLSADNKCQLLSTAESIFFIPVFFFFFLVILPSCIVLRYNNLGSEEVAFYKLF